MFISTRLFPMLTTRLLGGQERFLSKLTSQGLYHLCGVIAASMMANDSAADFSTSRLPTAIQTAARACRCLISMCDLGQAISPTRSYPCRPAFVSSLCPRSLFHHLHGPEQRSEKRLCDGTLSSIDYKITMTNDGAVLACVIVTVWTQSHWWTEIAYEGLVC